MNKYDVVVVGAGQAGLVMGFYLKQTNLSFILVDANERIGDSWRNRYDSLELFTPRTFSSLPGLKMSGAPNECPSKDEMASYLEEYSIHFDLPIKNNTSVLKVSRQNSLFEILTNQGIISAKQVVVASGAFQTPFIPPVIKKTSPTQFHIHSSSYRAPKQIPKGSVLVVGAGNSGVQIAIELAKDRNVTLAVSKPIKYLPLHFFGKSIFKWLEFLGLLYAGIDTKKGRWIRKQSDPIFGTTLKKNIAKNLLHLKPKVKQVNEREVLFADNTVQFFENIIWATGYRLTYDWIQIEGAISPSGEPIHERGISPSVGLYFVGLPWQYQRGSALICGVGRDAKHLIPYILKQQ